MMCLFPWTATFIIGFEWFDYSMPWCNIMSLVPLGFVELVGAVGL